jgi:hypothetical protein
VLTRARFPTTLPVVVGANFTLRLALPPTLRISGNVSPLILNPAPVTVGRETVKLTVPTFFSVSGKTLLFPTRTFPKFKLVGVTDRVPVELLLVVPPEREILVGEFVALLATETVPVRLPLTVGANLTLKETLCPGARLRGRERPLMLNPLTVTVA